MYSVKQWQQHKTFCSKSYVCILSSLRVEANNM